MNALMLLLVSLVPFLLALGLMLAPLRRIALTLAPLAALPALLLSIFMPVGISLELPWLLFGSHFGFDETARVFLFFSSVLWLVAGIYSAGYFSKVPSTTQFFVWFLLAMAGNLGLILAQDMVVFYTLFALMSFASYGLVVHTRSREALRAGRIYIILVVVGEVALFAAFALAAQAAGGTDFESVRQTIAAADTKNQIIALVILGFGIKAGFLGLHVWLPLAHPVAPTPASAVLSGAMISAGLLGWLQVLPLGQASLPVWGSVMIVVGMASTFYAVLVGVLQNNAKTVLAYSSISSMGIMTMAVGLGLIAPQNWPLILAAILIYALQHGLAKGALFLGVGMLAKPPISKLRRYLLIAVLMVPVLSLAGAPLSSGMIAKYLLKLQLVAVESPWADWVMTLMPFAALASGLLLARFVFLVWPKERIKSEAVAASGLMWFSWLSLILVVVISPWLIPGLDLNTDPTANSGAVKVLVSALSSLALVAGVALVVWWVTRFRQVNLVAKIPAGDMLIVVEKGIWPVVISILLWVSSALQIISTSLLRYVSGWFDGSESTSILEVIEGRLRAWTVATTLLLTLVMLFVLMSIL